MTFAHRHLLLGLVCAAWAGLIATPPTAAADTLIVLNKEEASAWLLDPMTGEVRAKIPVGVGPHEAAVSSDGRLAVVANYGGQQDGSTLSVVDVARGKVRRTISLGTHRRPHGIAFTGDDRHVLVTSEQSRAILEVDVLSGRIRRVHDAGGDAHLLEVRGDVAYASSIGEGSISEIDLSGDHGPRVLDTGAGTEALALRPGKRELWVGNNATQEVVVIDLDAWRIVDRLEVGLQPIRLAFTKDGRFAVASCFLSGDLAVLDADRRRVDRRLAMGAFVLNEDEWKGKSQEEIRRYLPQILEGGARPLGLLPGPEGRYLYVANRGQKNVAVVDLRSWLIVRRLPTGLGPDGMAYSSSSSK